MHTRLGVVIQKLSKTNFNDAAEGLIKSLVRLILMEKRHRPWASGGRGDWCHQTTV